MTADPSGGFAGMNMGGVAAASGAVSSGSSMFQGLQMGGAGLQAIGDIFSGLSAAKADRANARIALNEATAEGVQMQTKAQMNLGRVRSAYGAGGVVVNTGSPLHVMGQTALEGDLSSKLALYRGQVTAAADRAAAKSAELGGFISAGTTLLTAGAKAAMGGM
jgi:hypothetical protein